MKVSNGVRHLGKEKDRKGRTEEQKNERYFDRHGKITNSKRRLQRNNVVRRPVLQCRSNVRVFGINL